MIDEASGVAANCQPQDPCLPRAGAWRDSFLRTMSSRAGEDDEECCLPPQHPPVSLVSAAFCLETCSVIRVLLVCVWLESKRSEEHTSELQSLMRISYAVFCLKKKKHRNKHIKK